MGLNGNYLGGMTDSYLGENKYHPTKESLFEELISIPGKTWFFHNGARFDFIYFAKLFYEWAMQEGRVIQTKSQGEKIIGLILSQVDEDGKVNKKNDIVIRDSVALIPSSLYELTKAYAPDFIKLKGDIDFDAGEYFDPNNEKHMNYLRRDVDGLFAGLVRYHEISYENFGVMPAWTAGSTAIRAWKTTIPEKHVHFRQTATKEDFARKAFRGGFVYPGTSTNVHKDVTGIDVRAAYGRAMKLPVPTGIGRWVKHFVDEYMGVYYVYAKNERGGSWPFVPASIKGSLHWTNESCYTYLTTPEIIWYAKRGWSFTIIEGLVYERSEAVFAELMKKCEAFEYPDGVIAEPAQKAASKIIRNSLFGKTAMKDMHDQIMLSGSEPDQKINAIPMIDHKTGEIVDGVYVVEEKSDANYINPHFAAYITAYQRLYLFEAIEKVGVEYVYYCDTDSIKGDRTAIHNAIDKGLISVSLGYGNFEIDGEYEWLQVLGPKNYHGEYTEAFAEKKGLKDKWFGKSKGTPTRELYKHKDTQSLAAGGEYVDIEWNGLISLKRALTQGTDQIATKPHRKVSNIDNSMGWMKLEDGTIRPRPLPKMKPDVEITDNKKVSDTFNAKELIEMLQESMSLSEIAEKTVLSRPSIYSILNEKTSGKKYVTVLKQIANQTLNAAINV